MESPLEKAHGIIRTSRLHGYSHGELIIHTLLDGRRQDSLDVEELRALAQGYNWWGKHCEAYDAICTALARQSEDFELLTEAAVYAGNTQVEAESPTCIYDDLIRRQLGPAWFWRIRKAWVYEMIATGEAELEDYEWQVGDDIPHPAALEQAIDELMQAAVKGNSQAMTEVQKHIADQPAIRRSPRFDDLLAQMHAP